MRTLLVACLSSLALTACGVSDEAPPQRADPISQTRPAQPVALSPVGGPPAIAKLLPSPAVESLHVPSRTVIRLVQRAGLSTTGLRFSPRIATVDASEAAILISSSDCGARGRWVDLVAGAGFSFCARNGAYPDAADCTWSTTIPIGGSDANGTGLAFLVRQAERVVGRFQVVDVTPTPFEWYETEAPFDVTVDAFTADDN